MSRRDAWARPQDTPLAYIILLAYAVLMFDGRPPDSELTLAQWGRHHLSSSGWDVQQGQVWRLLSYAFVHGGFVHVAMNAMSLLALGPALERWLGTAKFALLYAITAISGALAAIWWDGPLTPLVGGSGALFGMIGAYVAINMRAGRHLLDFLEHGGASSLLGVLAANLILGLVIPQISNSAHLGGLLGGFVLTFCFLEPARTPADAISRWARAGWIALFLSNLAFACWPVTRADWIWTHAQMAPEAAERARFEAAWRTLQQLDPRAAAQVTSGLVVVEGSGGSESRR